MQCEQFLVTIGSDRPGRLRAFYRNVVGLTPMDGFAPGAFVVSPAAPPSLIIEAHDAVVGASKEPERLILNFAVADAVAYRRLRPSAAR